MELTVENVKGENTYYAPVLLKVTGVSKYNPDEISFEGLDGFWKVPTDRVPPVGVIAWFKLKIKPKVGANAKPGSVYRDIVEIIRAGEDDKARYAPETHSTGSSGSYQDKELASGSTHAVASVPTIEQRILLGMAFNNLTAVLSSSAFHEVELAYPSPPTEDREWFSRKTLMIQQWWTWFHETSRGLPLSPVTDPLPAEYVDTAPTMEDAARMDSEADAVLGRPEPAEDVEHLPW